jgi:hypothetical protein
MLEGLQKILLTVITVVLTCAPGIRYACSRLTLQSPEVALISVPPGLTFKYSAICLHSALHARFCMDVRTDRIHFAIPHKLIVFYNRDGVCLLRGTDYSFTRNLS